MGPDLIQLMNLIRSYVRKLYFGSSLCGFKYRMEICILNRDFANYARLQMNEDLWNTVKPQGRDSSVGIAIGYGLDIRGSISSKGKILPITVASRSKVWIIFAHSNTEIVGSNPTQGMDVCVYSVFMLGNGLATGWSPFQGVLQIVLD
jgi:hypothetical protein